MPSFFDLFRRGNRDTASMQDNIIQDLDRVRETPEFSVKEVKITEDNSESIMLAGTVESITESVVHHSPDRIASIITGDDFQSTQLLNELKSSFSLDETFQENEEMSRDSVVGGAMEVLADDATQVDERQNKIVYVEAKDEGLAKYLQGFLDENINISSRIWTWTLEVIKHGDFKLRRREYYIGSRKDGVKNVFYEDIINPYKVVRIEYMGKPLGYRDEDTDENNATFEKPEEFVHFLSVKNSKREKVTLKIRNSEGQLEDVVCYKVFGTSLMDNSRYIYRIVNLLDNMLILSRVARSSQFNLIKVEVGNASPAKTDQILGDVRRRIEGTTKMRKNAGMKSDASPIPVNSNIFIPTRDGKGEIQVDSVNESLDVRSITDIDYFKDKEFATLKVPKSYLGMGDEALGSLANNSLVRLDARYGRSVQKVQNIMINGVTELCNNYLQYRGRRDDINKFTIKMRPLDTADTMTRIEELMTNMQAIDAVRGSLAEGFAGYVDKAKLLNTTLNLVGMSPTSIANEEFLKILDEMEKGTYKEENHKIEEPEEDAGGGMGW